VGEGEGPQTYRTRQKKKGQSVPTRRQIGAKFDVEGDNFTHDMKKEEKVRGGKKPNGNPHVHWGVTEKGKKNRYWGKKDTQLDFPKERWGGKGNGDTVKTFMPKRKN